MASARFELLKAAKAPRTQAPARVKSVVRKMLNGDYGAGEWTVDNIHNVVNVKRKALFPPKQRAVINSVLAKMNKR